MPVTRLVVSACVTLSFLVASATPFAAGAQHTTKRVPATLSVDVIDGDTQKKIHRHRFDLRSPAWGEGTLGKLLVSANNQQDSCSLIFVTIIGSTYAVACESTSTAVTSKTTAWGDCEVTDEKHPVGLQFYVAGGKGPNWVLWTWCTLE